MLIVPPILFFAPLASPRELVDFFLLPRFVLATAAISGANGLFSIFFAPPTLPLLLTFAATAGAAAKGLFSTFIFTTTYHPLPLPFQ